MTAEPTGLKAEVIKDALNESLDACSEVEKIYQQYLALMLLCALKPGIKQQLIENPHATLKEYVPGMKIPEYAEIHLDPNERRWPDVVFETKEEDEGEEKRVEHQYYESSLTVKYAQFKKGKEAIADVTKRKYPNPPPIKKEVPINKDKKEKVIIKLPLFVPETDLLTEYRYQDQEDAEIILSCC